MKTIIAIISSAFILINLTLPAHAGNRYYPNESGFFLFDLFAQAPDSKYRKGRPKVRGFRKKVGGYSYKYSDTLNGYGNRPGDFNPIFDGRGLFSERLGTDGPYIGN
jgi:hypothetical protein